MQEIKKIIGENIRYERKKRNMSLSDLAKILHISNGFLGLTERGQRGMDITKYLEVANIFDISLIELTIIRNEEKNNLNDTISEYRRVNKLALLSMIHDLTLIELEFIVKTIQAFKALKKMNKE